MLLQAAAAPPPLQQQVARRGQPHGPFHFTLSRSHPSSFFLFFLPPPLIIHT